MSQNKTKSKVSVSDILFKLGPLMVLALLCIAYSIILPDTFPTVANAMNILRQASINCFLAAGMLVALITAGIDLSVGFNAILSTCMIGVLMQKGITSAWILIPLAILVSTFCGFLNGTLYTRLDLPHPYVSTLGMKFVYWGVALLITKSQTIGLFNKGIDAVLWIGSKTIFPFRFPVSFILVLIVFAIYHVFLTKSALGRQIYCVGGNPEAARMSGIRSKDVLTIVYTISGFMAGIAGIVIAGRVNTANANSATTYDTDAVAACIIGGASFRGGKGTIWGTLIGALLIATIRDGLDLLSKGNDIQYIVIGLIIVAAVTLDVFRGKVEANARKMASAK